MPEPRTPAAWERLTRPARFAFAPGAETARPGTVPVEIRNGLPEFKPYVYRGVGYDIYSGEGDDDA